MPQHKKKAKKKAKKKKREEAEYFPLTKGTLANVITVDPGFSEGSGFVHWPKIDQLGSINRPSNWKASSPKSSLKTWQRKCDFVIGEFRSFIDEDACEILFVEMPGLWSGSEISQAAASRGDIFKLACLVGRIEEVFKSYREEYYGAEESPVIMVSPQLWKGQLPKKVTAKRIFNALGQHFPDHVDDAIGIGLSIQNLI